MPHQIFRTFPTRSQLPQRKYTHLTPEHLATWFQYGYIHLRSAFPRAAAAHKTADLFPRLGFDPANPDTWQSPITYLPGRDEHTEQPSSFAPKAWAAICELCGGAERINTDDCDWWDDGFIVNVGAAEDEGRETNRVDEVDGWHVDGDFFVHFLDSPEQALLLVPCWGDVIEGAGGTVVCTDGIGKVARHLYENPGGVDESLIPMNQPNKDRWVCGEIVDECRTFFELTGEAGDVFVLHPLMIHSAAKNGLRIPRIITNPGVRLKQPFNFDRDDPNEYSLIELKTLQELGMDRLRGWKIMGERSPLKSKWREEEDQRRSEREEEVQRLEQERQEKIREEMMLRESHQRMLLSRRPPPIPASPLAFGERWCGLGQGDRYY